MSFPPQEAARWESLVNNSCLLSGASLLMKLDRLLNMYSRLSTANTTSKSKLESRRLRCSIELYRWREKECSMSKVVKWRVHST